MSGIELFPFGINPADLVMKVELYVCTVNGRVLVVFEPLVGPKTVGRASDATIPEIR